MLVKVTTDQGFEGWGEAFGLRAVTSSKLTVDELIAPICIGQDATRIAPLMLEVQKKLHVFGRNGPFANTPDPSELYIFSAPLPAARRYHQSRSRGRRFWSSHAARGYRYDANHATGVIIAYQARDQDGIKLNGVVQRVLDHSEDFAYTDDPEFSTIRRKLARWAADNVPIVKELRPPQPPGFNNRLSANWKPLLQIAQHAGGGWPERARRSAIYLSRAPYEPSVRVQLLAALRAMFTKNGTEIHIGAGGAGASRPSRF